MVTFISISFYSCLIQNPYPVKKKIHDVYHYSKKTRVRFQIHVILEDSGISLVQLCDLSKVGLPELEHQRWWRWRIKRFPLPFNAIAIRLPRGY